MKLDDVFKVFLAGSILIELVVLALVCASLVAWLGALIHCIKHRHDKDRMLWVLIVLLGGPIGAILYWTMGRMKAVAASPTPLSSAQTAFASRPINPHFDHAAIHDEKLRTAAISQALTRSVKGRR
ncbi:MAG: PLDc N-terminal domain-containing protein [Opitutus sp.]